MTLKELDEIEVEARKEALKELANGKEGNYKRWKNRIVLLIVIAPSFIFTLIYCLGEKEWPSWDIVKFLIGLVIVLEAARFICVWTVEHRTIEIMEERIKNANANNDGGKDNG